MTRLCSVLALALLLSGCALVKAREAADAGFIPPSARLAENRQRAPFHGYWVADGKAYEARRFAVGRVAIAPVDVAYALKQYAASRSSSDEQRIEEIEELGRYFREKTRLALAGRGHIHAVADDEPNPEVLTLKLALVDVVPTSPAVNVVGTVAGYFLPGGGLIKVLGEGSVAFEGFVEDNESPADPLTPPAGPLPAQSVSVAPDPAGSPMQVAPPVSKMPRLWEAFKDREGHKVSAFSFKDYQRYAHIRVAIDEWADQLATLLDSTQDVMVEDRYIIAVNPF